MRGQQVSLLSLAAISALSFASSGLSQLRNDAGFGTVKRSFNISARVAVGPNSGNDFRVTAAVFLNGKTYVTSDTNRDTNHWLYILSATGEYEGFIDVARTGAIKEGLILYDMATDGQSLIVGVGETDNQHGIDELAGIYVLSPQGNLVNQLMADNGPQAIVNPIRGAGFDHMKSFEADTVENDPTPRHSPYRAVEYDPSGNNGDGSLWVADDGGVQQGNTCDDCPILEIDLQGNILREFVNNPDGNGDPDGGWWHGAGLARENQLGNLWVLADDDDRIIEVDINTGVPTGNFFLQERFPDGFRGGLDGLPGGDPGSTASDFDMLVLSRINNDDHIAYQRMNLYPNMPGVTEPILEANIGPDLTFGDNNSSSPIIFTAVDTLNFGINPNGQASGFPVLHTFNFGDDALTDVTTELFGLGILPEFRAASPFSDPVATGLTLQIAGSTDAVISIDLSATSFPVQTGDTIRVQSIYLDPRSQFSPGLMASNEIWYSGIGFNQVRIEANGERSDRIHENGYFNVTYLGGPAITGVTFDFTGSSNPGLEQASFDVDTGNQNDVFGMGRGMDPMGNIVNVGGCDGTYRNNSDVTAGLVYNMFNTTIGPNSPACDYWLREGYTFQSGFVGSNGAPDRYATLDFTFTDFGLDNGNPLGAGETEMFGFDVDTDGAPQRGGGHNGMVITIKFADMTEVAAELLPDGADRNRSFIGF